MATVKVILRKKTNSKGENPIAVRITKDRKSSYLYTGQYVSPTFWDERNQRVKKSHPNSSRLNNFIYKKLSEANDKLLELESTDKKTTARSVKKVIKGKNDKTTFFELAETYLNQLEANGKFNRLRSERPRIKHFKAFLKGNDIGFHEITEIKLKQFQAYLTTVRGVSHRTVINYLIVIRTIFNLAIRQGIVEQKLYPFGKGKIVLKFPPSMKLGLVKEEIKQLEELDLGDSPKEAHARNIFFISFYFAGMRVSDVLRLKWSDFKDDRLYYQMGKNKKIGSLKIPEKAKAILIQYEADKQSSGDFVFPELKKANLESPEDITRKIANNTKTINKYLRRIAAKMELDKPLSSHIARHSFANISGDKIPIQMLQKLYRHSNITTTINYQQNFIYKDADDALDAVIDF